MSSIQRITENPIGQQAVIWVSSFRNATQ